MPPKTPMGVKLAISILVVLAFSLVGGYSCPPDPLSSRPVPYRVFCPSVYNDRSDEPTVDPNILPPTATPVPKRTAEPTIVPVNRR